MPGGGGKGGGSSTVTVNNGPVSVDADSTVEVVGLDNINVTATLAPSPLRTESKQEIVLPQPLTTETKLDTRSDVTTDSTSAMSVDLRPVAMDVCLSTNASLPQGQIHQPFNIHLGMTVFGIEFFGLNFGGESRTVMQELPKKPAVTWPAQQNAAAPAPHREPAGRGARGLRVRVK